MRKEVVTFAQMTTALLNGKHPLPEAEIVSTHGRRLNSYQNCGFIFLIQHDSIQIRQIYLNMLLVII